MFQLSLYLSTQITSYDRAITNQITPIRSINISHCFLREEIGTCELDVAYSSMVKAGPLPQALFFISTFINTREDIIKLKNLVPQNVKDRH